MINTNELRIGNFCHAQKIKDISNDKKSALDKIREAYKNLNQKDFFKITSIHESVEVQLAHYLSNESSIFQIDEIYPIEITSDLLRLCGFKDKTYNTNELLQNHLTIDGDVPIRISEYDGKTRFSAYVFDKNSGSNTFLRQISYLHQLQNLYFELRGENLNLVISASLPN